MSKKPNETLLSKLSPNQLRLSPKMRWLIDSITGQDNGARGPRGEAPGPLSITSDGYLMHSNMFIGDAQDLAININGILKVICATNKEKQAFAMLYQQNVTDWRI